MKKNEIKEDLLVRDTWWREWGVGKIKNVKKTVFDVQFGSTVLKFDYAHAQFLEVENE